MASVKESAKASRAPVDWRAGSGRRNDLHFDPCFISLLDECGVGRTHAHGVRRDPVEREWQDLLAGQPRHRIAQHRFERRRAKRLALTSQRLPAVPRGQHRAEDRQRKKRHEQEQPSALEHSHLLHLPLGLKRDGAVELRGFRDDAAGERLLARQPVHVLLERHAAAENCIRRRLPNAEQLMQGSKSAHEVRPNTLRRRIERGQNALRSLMHPPQPSQFRRSGMKEERAARGHLVQKRELKAG